MSTDTRANLEGSVFFCLKGPNFDANTFAEKALEQGAAHVVADDESHRNKANMTVVQDALEALQDLAAHHRAQFDFPVIGLTGSNGKTTNKELIAAVLMKKYRTYSTKGNLNNHIGVPLTLLSIPLDAEIAVIEMGANHQGEIKMLTEICNPTAGIITNIGKAHLEGFGGIEGVRKGKGELFDFLKKKPGHLVFLNGDDLVLNEMAEGMNKCSYGTHSGVFIQGFQGEDGRTVQFSYREQDYVSRSIESNLAGDYNLINLLAAVCVGRYFKVPHDDIADALEAYEPNLNRSQWLQTGNNTLLLDAYNANPSSMQLALENFAKVQADTKLAVLGHMLELGEDAPAEHQALIDQLRTLNLRAILVGEYFENCHREGFQWCNDTNALLELLKQIPIKNATILLKGSRMVALEKAKELL